jgi:hypothetical protein
LYQQFGENSAFILPRHHFLFTSRPLEDRLKGSYDTMAAWLRSVDEAIQVLQHQVTSEQVAARSFFPVSAMGDHSSADTDSTYTSHSNTSEGTLSLEPTVATTVTSHTLSSAASSASVIHHLCFYSDDDSLTSLISSASGLSFDQDTITMSSAALPASVQLELGPAQITTPLEVNRTPSPQGSWDSATVASEGNGSSSQHPSIDTSLSWTSL